MRSEELETMTNEENLLNITKMEGRAAWADHVLNGCSDCLREMKKARKKLADTQRNFILDPDDAGSDTKENEMDVNFQCLCDFIRQAALMVNTTREWLEKRVEGENLDESILEPQMVACSEE